MCAFSSTSFSFPFLYINFHFSCCFNLNVRSYLVVTVVCHRAPCNKLLIFLKKKKTLTKLYQIPEGKLRSETRGTESDFECRETQPFVPIDTGLNVSLLTLHEDGDYDISKVRMEQRSKVIISILV